MLIPVTTHPRASLRRVLEDLGPTLLDLVCGDPNGADDIGGVVIHDPHDEPVPPPQALVLGVAVHGPAQIVHLLDALGTQGAAGLVVRAPVAVDEKVTAAVTRSGVALLGLTRGASWAQLAAMLRALIAEGDVGETGRETLGGVPSGDLFALANAVGALLDAPVTFEDHSWRVLAFSGRQDEADSSRVETILGRQVPERFTRVLEERGVFQAMYRSDRPVYVEPLVEVEGGDLSLPRVALAVRAGDEILGSIWAAVHGPLSAERDQALRDASKLVALHLLRLRAGADVERRLRADLVGTALEGGPGAADAVARLGLAEQPGVVLALAVADRTDGDRSAARHARYVAERQRLADAFAMHLTAVHPRSAAALVGDVVYGIVPATAGRPDAEERACRVADEFLERVGERQELLVGVGPLARESAALPVSRAGADRALRVLRAGEGTRSVARITDVLVESLLLELTDVIAERGDPPSGPVARLGAYDAAHHTCLVETLRAWLDAFGDVAAASAAVHVHPNTFRYRLRRLAEVGGLDLTDADARFAAMLQLRLWPHARRS
ncbi:helix-turn-helix domain-containing protein [Streptomyces durmitorensis]|uniref:Helix-turn-helix domain-containing protein n=1 Tax=Streptomyces durmitorensis TaxID=319947 RepID=A0ABY4Q448_9ACTN|nr:PucR family transcriptional regulator [Streptomyces durmitorensis]UQT59946.1 helix-turn-helix domain-containing protein [Streptomyces durmitorensis]